MSASNTPNAFAGRDYDTIASSLLELGNTFLATAEFQKDFYRHAPRFPPHYVYKSTQDHQELIINLFGQIAGSELGTVMSALGNHALKGPEGERVPVTDDSKVKDIITLEVPSNAPPLITAMFNNQIGTLNEIRIADEEEEMAAGQNPIVKEFARARPDSEDGTTELFNVHLPVKYVAPNQPNRSSPIKHIGKIQLDEQSLLSSTQPENSQAEVKNDTIPTDDEIRLGALYNPKLLYDYGGECFKHVHGKLVQHNVVDINDNLIPPWKNYTELRPGTLVLINATLHCFRFNTTGKRERKLYQIHARQIRVLATSHLPVQKRKIPSFPSNARPTYGAIPTSNTAVKDADSAFRNFRKRAHSETANEDDVDSTAKGRDAKGKKRELDAPAGKSKLHMNRKPAPVTNEDMEMI